MPGAAAAPGNWSRSTVSKDQRWRVFIVAVGLSDGQHSTCQIPSGNGSSIGVEASLIMGGERPRDARAPPKLRLFPLCIIGDESAWEIGTQVLTVGGPWSLACTVGWCWWLP